MSQQNIHTKKNEIKQYFTFILAVFIIPVYVLILVIQRLEELFEEPTAKIDHPEIFVENKTDLMH